MKLSTTTLQPLSLAHHEYSNGLQLVSIGPQVGACRSTSATNTAAAVVYTRTSLHSVDSE